jgi:hypothetical protein
VQVQTSESSNMIPVGQFEITEMWKWNTERLVHKRVALGLLQDSENVADVSVGKGSAHPFKFLRQTSYQLNINKVQRFALRSYAGGSICYW